MPPNRKPVNKDPDKKCFVTEYNGRYQSTTAKRGPFPRLPTDKIYSDGDFNFDTTNKLVFDEKKIPPAIQKPQKTVQEHKGAMELQTEYDDHYLGVKEKPASQMPYFKMKTQPFGIDPNTKPSFSVTSIEFNEKKHNRVEKCPPPQGNIKPVDTVGFTEESIHKSDFVDFKKPRSAIRKQPDMIQLSADPLEKDTTNRTNYVSHKQLPLLVKKKEIFKPNIEPFTGDSLMKVDFPSHGNLGKKIASAWDHELFKSSQPFSKETSNTVDYQKWRVPPKQVKVKEVYVREKNPMELIPVSADYIRFQDALPARSLRPRTNLRPSSQKFDSKSIYAEKFSSLKLPQVKIKELKHSRHQSCPLVLGGDKSNYESESMGVYRPFREAPSKKIYHQNKIFPEDTFNGLTTYKNDYPGKKIECSTDAIIANKFQDFKCIDDFETGHRYLERSSVKNNTASTAMLPSMNALPTAVAVS